ncbi:MAG TPA: nitrate reductase molybdenum cofactor assembly chaperone [Alphaproteobacteria bacterium]|nr:nitrate reductase molybdenum cofactor assembly chaperone [Alphaproteobacteria bacterium]
MARAGTRSYRALGCMLTYPERGWIEALPELIDTLAQEGLVGRTRLVELRALASKLQASDLIEAQEQYVGLFDRSRRVSLHLFEHVHGESRDRGMAMVNLGELYAAAGLLADPNELPDFLPMYLEYLSVLPREQARRSLGDVGAILQAIHARLVERDSPYQAVFAVLLDIAGLAPAEVQGAAEPADDTPEALDRVWEEAAVTFGPENDPAKGSGCGKAGAMLERMNELDAARGGREVRK